MPLHDPDDPKIVKGLAAFKAEQEPEVVHVFWEEETPEEIRSEKAYQASLERLRTSIIVDWCMRLNGTARRYP